MGTAKSSTGPASGVPLVPPWVPDPVHPVDGDGNGDPEGQSLQDQPAPAPQPAPIAPKARFGTARRRLNIFARTGSADDMRRGLGHYIRKGYSGASSATRRMGGTVRTAGILYGAFSSAAEGKAAAPGSPFDPALLDGRSADVVMDALVEAVRPIDGTQDAEAGRRAIRNALSELLDRFPEADLLDLSEDQRIFAIERFVALDIYNRVVLDLGKTIQDKAPSASAALSRLKDIKDYVKQTVSARFRTLKKAAEQLGALRIPEMVSQALEETFEVFEEYVQ